MKNLLEDTDVMDLYKDLKNNKYENIDDYLTSFLDSDYQDGIPTKLVPKKKLPAPSGKIFWDGKEITVGIEYSDDYGL